ncbi:MAG: PBP1A family penicillin-binding protein [Rubrivivax sp.]|nr:PBP1A family penicillin-binding protein [Rubrivivax sp.]
MPAMPLFPVPHRLMQVGRRPALAGALLLALLLPVPVARAALLELPPIDRIVNYQPKLHLQILTADGVEIGAFGTERRQFVPIGQIPKLLQDAVLAVEDTRFREHAGIDPKGMARAALAMLTGGMRQGASTITQQLVRTMLLTQRFTPERKAKEILLALKVEQAISKDRILEIYLNEIFLGERAYGFAAAAQTYFGKSLKELNLAETAMLAGLPQNPHYANPVQNLERASARQRIVLQRMKATGVISEAQLQAAAAERLKLRPPRQQLVVAPHVAEMARRVVVERFGAEASYTSGLRVVTSLRASEQQAAHAAVLKAVLGFDRRQPWRGPEDLETLAPQLQGAELERAAARALKDHRDDDLLRVAIVLSASPQEVQAQLPNGERAVIRGEGLRRVAAAVQPKARAPLKIERGSIVRLLRDGTQWRIEQWPEVEAAFVALDAQSGRVRALVGGFEFARQPFNHVTQAQRQPGSSFKPFLYSAALEHRIMPATLIDDLPFSAPNGWSPQNSDGRFDGPLSLRDALARSKNLVSVRLLQQLGVADTKDWAERFGIDPARQPDNLTLALGTGSVSPMQLAQAYAPLANGGWRVAPVLVERIVDAQGRTLFEAPAPAAFTEANRAVPERNAWLMTQLLGEVTRSGTAARAQATLKRPDVYGKTGTTDDAVDAWFAGYHPSVVGVAWVGYGQPRSLGERESGGGLALPIWIDYMATALRAVPVTPPPPAPAGLVRSGDDWLYAEWLQGGWTHRILADGGAQQLPTVMPPEAGASGAAPARPGPSPAQILQGVGVP